ncbi:MAG: peptidylprolyl isomerase [Sedimentisphaerales bacterium]|nr:peptidylprolyl isomerase [Sedimentisphaerales bacterium]
MKNVTYICRALAILIITSILIITGCKDKTSTTTDSNTTSTVNVNPTGRRPLEELLQLPDINEVAVTVNGVEIKEGKIQEIIKPQMQRMKESLQNAPETIQVQSIITQNIKTLHDQALQQLIVEQLLEEQVKDIKIEMTNEEADKIFKERLASQAVDMNEFKKVLEENDISYDEVLDEVKKEQTYTKFIDSKMDDSINVSEEEAKKYYDENQKAFDRPEQVRASHILVRFQPDESQEVKEKAKEKIDDLLRQIREGADFAELAKETGGFPTAPDGGDLGYFERSMMDPNFEKASFELAVNDVSEVVETDYGYHIIKVTDHTEEGIIPFDEIKEKLIDALSEQKKAGFTEKYIESLIKEADIKFPTGKEMTFQFSEQG